MDDGWRAFSGKDGRRTEVRFRSLREGDEKAFQKCIESYYGDGYPYKEYIKEEYLISRIKDGRMVVMVGEDRKGEIVSITGVRTDTAFKGSATLFLRVVSADVQKMGIASAAETELLRMVPRDDSICSFYADVVTQNDFSQRSLDARNYTACGFRFCLYQADVLVPKQKWKAGQRLSLVIMCHKERDMGTLQFYCPKELRQSVGRMYDSLGVCVRFLDENEPPEREDTVLTETFETDHDSLLWYVHQVGKDYVLRLSEAKDVSVFIIYINLYSPGAEEMYLKLLSENFFYSGIKPLGDGEEYLIMTRLSGGKLKCEDIHLTAQGNILLDEIIQIQREDVKNDE